MSKQYAWLGPVLVFAGTISYFLVFARIPALRDFPWVNLPLVLIGLGLSAIAVRTAFHPPAARRTTIAAITGFVFSLILAALFNVYVFVLSYQLPEPTAVAQVQDLAPDFSLLDHNGNTVKRSDFLGRKLVVVFYRGHW